MGGVTALPCRNFRGNGSLALAGLAVVSEQGTCFGITSPPALESTEVRGAQRRRIELGCTSRVTYREENELQVGGWLPPTWQRRMGTTSAPRHEGVDGGQRNPNETGDRVQGGLLASTGQQARSLRHMRDCTLYICLYTSTHPSLVKGGGRSVTLSIRCWDHNRTKLGGNPLLCPCGIGMCV